jgi:hypothetical protein
MKIIQLLSALFLLHVCQLTNAQSAEIKNFQLTKISNFEICQNDRDSCVDEHTALRDLYKNQSIEIINNFGMIEDKTLVSIIGSLKFSDGKDLYAIFFSQSNKIEPKQGLSTCHACGANFGMAIYQFHNKWKLFGVNNNIDELGSFGFIPIDKSNLQIFPASPERFYITLSLSFMAQGYIEEKTIFFEVNSDALYPIKSDNLVKIISKGFISTGESSCNAKADGEEWTSRFNFKNIKSAQPTIKLVKYYNKCGIKKTFRTQELNYVYNHSKKGFSTSDK